MNGVSIDQTRVALLRVLKTLRSYDFFNIVLFGSGHKRLFPTQMEATEANLKVARHMVERLQADMGGTEVGKALTNTYAIPGPSGVRQDVLLITDGEVWGTDQVVREATGSGHTVFTVGVGASVAERFVRELADSTGGACEMVVPNEGMADKIHRHFQRIFLPRVRDAKIVWPATPMDPTPINAVYSGDTLHMFNRFSEPPVGDTKLVVTLDDGRVIEETASLETVTNVVGDRTSNLARLAAHQRLAAMTDDSECARHAVAYQLISEFTNYLVVDQRPDDQKAQDLPELRKISSMLSAGWGGVGKEFLACCELMPTFSASVPRMANCIPPDLCMKSASAPRMAARRLFVNRLKNVAVTSTIRELFDHGLPQDIADQLMQLVVSGHAEHEVVILFLQFLITGPNAAPVPRTISRVVIKTFKALTPTTELVERVKGIAENFH